jgi:hypothetical protein
MNSTESSMCAAALRYAEQGFYVFPVPLGTKKSYKSAQFTNGRRWGATTDPEEIRHDFALWPNANVGIATGPDSGFFVIETDTPEGHNVDGLASLKKLEAKHGQLPETLMAESPSRSRHHYFKYPAGIKIKNSTSKIGAGIDSRGDGGMMIAPPSVKPGVGEYKWLNKNAIADAPIWLIELLTAGDSDAPRTPGREPDADFYLVAAALAVIPNRDLDWDDWNKIGMATWRATGGSNAGFEVFDTWSQKSSKYAADNTGERWQDYLKSPPTEIGAGTLFYLANEAAPGWSKAVDLAGVHAPEFFRLAGLSPIEYERARQEVAKRLGYRVSVLDKIVDELRQNHDDGDHQGQRLTLPEIEPWIEPVDGSQLLADMITAIRAHIVLTDQQALAVVLWIVHVHLLDCAEHSARLHLASPAPRCGKTALLRTIEQMVPRALSAENVSTAAMFRVIAMARPTLLIDEVDSFLNGENREDLRGLLNAGHTPGGTVIRVVGEDFEPRAFRVWGAVVLAGIGQIPMTIEDRSITINMRRRLSHENIDRLRRDAVDRLKMLGRRVARWAADNRSAMSDADPAMPDALNDRAIDNWRPLVAIADCVGPDAGLRAREAAVALASEGLVEESNAILALADVAATFAEKKMDWISSADLVAGLVQLEGRPWKEWNRGHGLTQNSLARLLRPFSIFSKKRREPGKLPIRGYDREPVVAAAERYVEGVEKAEEATM